MNCQEFRQIMHSYIDRELTEFEYKRAEAHVAECPSCSREVTQYRQVCCFISECCRLEAPDQILSKIHITIEKRNLFRRTLRPLPHVLPLAAAFAFAIILSNHLSPPTDMVSSSNAKYSDATYDSSALSDTSATAIFDAELTTKKSIPPPAIPPSSRHGQSSFHTAIPSPSEKLSAGSNAGARSIRETAISSLDYRTEALKASNHHTKSLPSERPRVRVFGQPRAAASANIARTDYDSYESYKPAGYYGHPGITTVAHATGGSSRASYFPSFYTSAPARRSSLSLTTETAVVDEKNTTESSPSLRKSIPATSNSSQPIKFSDTYHVQYPESAADQCERNIRASLPEEFKGAIIKRIGNTLSITAEYGVIASIRDDIDAIYSNASERLAMQPREFRLTGSDPGKKTKSSKLSFPAKEATLTITFLQ